MKNLICILLIFAGLTVKAQQLFSINGTVTDKMGAVPGAVVFLTNTKYITSTKNNGKFSIEDLQPGTYELVIKMIGYNPSIQRITLAEKSASLAIKLDESNKLLKGVVINETDPNRGKFMKDFTRHFIGESTNSMDCKIINPEVLEFHYDKATGMLTASSEKLLIVENRGLGYRLNFLITQFEFDSINMLFYYTGYPYFEELKGSPSQQKKWEENRRVAYAGSFNHFFRSVYNNTSASEGFSVFNIPQKVTSQPTAPIRPINADSLFMPVNTNLKKLSDRYDKVTDNDTTELYVVYRGAKASFNFTESNLYIQPPVRLSTSREQLSKIQPLTKDIAVSKNGVLIPAKSFLVSGYWAWKKVAELTPLDYYDSFSNPELNPPKSSKIITLQAN
ncbi:MAG TPA: carboxypeptidase-like regulatory domain-containing protein [Mucilaginibacter sp.]